MDAIKVLKDDHKRVRALFDEVEQLSDRATAARKKLFTQIEQELETHSAVEETVFYPEFKQRAAKGEETDEVLEAYEEHNVVKFMLEELQDLDPKDETYKPKLNVLKELVEHHVREEERELFKMAKELFDKDELSDLGERILEAKEDLGAA